MESTGVTVFVNLAPDTEPAVWLRVGSGRLRADGSVVVTFDRRVALGWIRMELWVAAGPPGRERPAPARARGMPPLPAVRRVPRSSTEVSSW